MRLWIELILLRFRALLMSSDNVWIPFYYLAIHRWVSPSLSRATQFVLSLSRRQREKQSHRINQSPSNPNASLFCIY